MLFTDKHGQLFVRYHVVKLGGVCDVITVRCGVVLIQRGVQETGHRFTSQPIRRLETVNKDVSDSAVTILPSLSITNTISRTLLLDPPTSKYFK